MTELSDLLKRSGITARQAAEKATELGVDLPYGTIAAYWTGRHPRHPSEKTLEGLAEVTPVSLRRLRRAVGAPEGETSPWHPPAEANRLTIRQREALEQLIKAIVLAPLTRVGEQSEDWSSDLFGNVDGDARAARGTP